MSLLAFLAFGVLKRSAIPRALEMDVAFAAAAAQAENELLSVAGQIGDLGKGGRWKAEGGIGKTCLFVFFRLHPSAFRLINDSPDRHLHHFRQRAAPIHLLPVPVSAGLRLDDRLVKKV